MHVTKRDGRVEPMDIGKITERLRELCVSLNIKCAYSLIVSKVSSGLCDLITTSAIDELTAQEAAAMTINSTEYERLASAITVSNLQKSTGTFVDTCKALRAMGDTCPEYDELVGQYGEMLEKHIDYKRDFLNSYAAIKTAMTVTLAKSNGVIIERPQSNLMRVSLFLHGHDTQAVLSSYRMLSLKMCVHGTPVHINAGRNNRLASCYLPNIDLSPCYAPRATSSRHKAPNEIDIFYTKLKECAKISNGSGGIGFSCSSIPATGSVKATGGKHQGIIPALKMFDEMSQHSVNDGRKSAISPYLEVWHDDIELFVQSKLPHRKEELRCARLFPALWVPDLFMKRLLLEGDWSLFCPSTAPGLDTCWGDEFEKLYERYESEKRQVRTVKASYIWALILRTMEEAGGPFMLYKDACNRLANLAHWGCIKSSNLCTEIIQFSSAEETAVCNLGSISLAACVADGQFDHDYLFKIASQLVYNNDKIIDKAEHPMQSAKLSNGIHRTMGIGICGLADAFMLLRYPFSSPQARKLNAEIMETIYYAFLRTSCDIAKVRGQHKSYSGSKLSQGVLNYMQYEGAKPSGRWPFSHLQDDIKRWGVAHGLGVALMPTSNGSIMLDVNESFEPYSGNVYVRRIAAGEFMAINKHLETDLKKLELWIPSVKDHIMRNRGSIAGLDEIPDDIRELYKTIWEIPMKDQVDMVHDRMPWVDQSQSFSAHYAETNMKQLSNYHIYTWKKGLKTGMYYLRTTAALKADIISTANCTSCVV